MNELIEQLHAIDTPTVSNAVEKLKVRGRTTGFCSRAMRCLTPELGVLCGYAVTAEVETMSPNAPSGLDGEFVELCRRVAACPHPAVVVLKERSGQPEFSAHCGEVMATIFQRIGAIGVVSDSAIRDLLEVRALAFHYFAPGTVASHGNFRIVRSGIAVTVCGLEIEPGDLLHGDINGLITIPKEGIERLPQLVSQVRQAESKLMQYVKSDDFTIDGLAERLTH